MLRPLDMLKIGQLVLQKGEWNGNQLVSRSWIEISISSQGRIDRGHDYGFLWWRTKLPFAGKEVEAISASGNGGQAIIVVPELNLIAVFTAGNYNSRKSALPIPILIKFILPSIK
jgi:CubicO group peptidase (beta-lactamase class C family)